MADGSNIADWANVGATLIGSIGTTGALFVSYRLLRRELLRDRQRETQEEMGHAINVSCWSNRTHIFIKNASSLPVYDVALTFRHSGSRSCEYCIAYIGSMGPGGTRTRLLPKSSVSRNRYRFRSMMFRDTAGVRWQRDSYGFIRKLSRD